MAQIPQPQQSWPPAVMRALGSTAGETVALPLQTPPPTLKPPSQLPALTEKDLQTAGTLTVRTSTLALLTRCLRSTQSSSSRQCPPARAYR